MSTFSYHLSLQVALSVQLENMELVFSVLEQGLLHHDHGPRCAFFR